MNKNAVMIGAVAAGGLLLFAWKKKGAGLRTPLGIPQPSNSPGAAARVDNQQQPWYNGALGFLENKAAGYKQNPQLVQSDVQSVVHSAADVWGTVSGFFGSSGGTSDHVDAIPTASNSPGSDPTVQDPMTQTLPADGMQGSNMLGAQLGSFGDGNIDMTTISTSSSDSGTLIDSSSSDGSAMGSDNMMSTG